MNRLTNEQLARLIEYYRPIHSIHSMWIVARLIRMLAEHTP